MAWEYGGGSNPLIALLLPHVGSLPSEFVERVWGPLRFLPLGWCDKIFRMCRTPSLPLARNTLAGQALDAGATHLLWVDSDTVCESPPDPNEALRLLYLCDAPIAACLYRAKQKTGFNYAAWKKVEGGYAPIKQFTGNWFSVDVTGLHFCLIKREVFEKIPRPWFHWEDPGEISEDFHFFENAKKFGYETRIFAGVRMSHIGALKVKSDGSVSMPEV